MPAFACPFLKIPWLYPHVPEIMQLMTGTDFTAYLPSLLGKKHKFETHTHNSQKTYQI